MLKSFTLLYRCLTRFVPCFCLKACLYIRFCVSRNVYFYQILHCSDHFHLCSLDSETYAFSLVSFIQCF